MYQVCVIMHGHVLTDEEGPEGLTQFLLLEVQKLRVQLQNSRMSECRLSQRCRVAEDDRSRAERKAQELRHDRLQLERFELQKTVRLLGAFVFQISKGIFLLASLCTFEPFKDNRFHQCHNHVDFIYFVTFYFFSQKVNFAEFASSRLRQDWESASRELGKLKDRHLEQSVKYSRALEEQGKDSIRERDLLKQVSHRIQILSNFTL